MLEAKKTNIFIPLRFVSNFLWKTSRLHRVFTKKRVVFMTNKYSIT